MILRVVLVTDLRVVAEAELLRRLDALEALPAEARAAVAVQVRDPELPARAHLALAERLRRRTSELGALLFVNDRLDVAALVGADGVHLGRRSVTITEARTLLPGAVISASAHAREEASAAFDGGADVVLLSPIFASPEKGTPLGPRALGVGAPPGRALVALGGVDETNAAACLAAGATGVAAVRADLASWFAATLPLGAGPG